MERQKRISRIMGLFLRNRFSASTEERVQRWLIEERDESEKERASLAFWRSLGRRQYYAIYPTLARVAAVVVPLAVLTIGMVYFSNARTIEVVAGLGETRQVVLPDSSRVWLRAGTTIEYPRKFRNKRSIELVGEAYFAVTKDPARPFVVATDHLSVTVLGTEFNVKAYRGDLHTTTTLNSGRVEVATEDGSSRVLAPDEQLVYDSRTALTSVMEVVAADVSGWTSGVLAFSGAGLEEIVATLERQFNVTIDAPAAFYRSGEQYTIKFTRNETLEDILNVLRDVVGEFEYTKTGNTVSIISQ